MFAERVFEIEPTTMTNAAVASSSKFVFITYAVEIEGDAPLIFSIEAVDE